MEALAAQLNKQRQPGTRPSGVPFKSVPRARRLRSGPVSSPALTRLAGGIARTAMSRQLTDAGMMDLSAGVRPYALDADRAKALWAKSEEMVGEKF